MPLTVGVLPKSTRNPYFEDCRLGAQEAADELGFTLRWDGPPEADAARQARVTSTLSAPNQNAWIAEFKARLSREHPGLQLVDVRPSEDLEENARRETVSLLEAHPELKAIVGFCSPAVPGAAEAVKQLRRRGRCHIGTKGNLDSFSSWKAATQ